MMETAPEEDRQRRERRTIGLGDDVGRRREFADVELGMPQRAEKDLLRREPVVELKIPRVGFLRRNGNEVETPRAETPKAWVNCGIITLGAERSAYW